MDVSVIFIALTLVPVFAVDPNGVLVYHSTELDGHRWHQPRVPSIRDTDFQVVSTFIHHVPY
jgi:hypothetical protein